MPKIFDQKGIAPIILVIILTVVIAGVAGVAYKSQKEIKVRSNKTSEVTELKGAPEPIPKSENVNLSDSGRLADKPFAQKLAPKEATNSSVSSVPKFSIFPPAGWETKPPEGNYVVEFSSSSEDRISEGGAYFYANPNITVYISKQFKNFDEVVAAVRSDPDYALSQKSKSTTNGQEAYVFETVKDIRDIAKNLIEAQLKEEIAKAKKQGTQLSDYEIKEMRKNMDKVLEQTKVKIVSYLFSKDGYFINVTGKALEPFWAKRGPQIKRSMDTFKLE